MNNLTKKIYEEITSKKFINKNLLKKFEALNRNEGRMVLKDLIEMEKNLKLKKALMEIYEIDHYRYDKRLLIVAIWAAFNSFI